jgi:hypothetical protein
LAGLFYQERPMNNGRMIFSQVMDFLPLPQLRKCVARYDGNRKVQSFSCLDQLLCMAFAQLSYRESLRDIEVCLRAMRPKLYHMGIRGRVAKSTLADANEKRDWRIYADFARILIDEAKTLYAHEDFGIELQEAAVYALDSTTIDLCLALFPWARFRRTKAAIKLHTLLNLRGSIPEFIHISEGKMHDVNVLDILVPQPGAYYIMDRGYVDFARLYTIHQSLAFFVTRAKRGMVYYRLASRRVSKRAGLRSDQTIRLAGMNTATDYPELLRRVRYHDADNDKTFVFITNNFALPALTIAQLYRARWQIELFFKWIKQHLRIKAFFGTSENAVKTQVWISVSVYVLVAILKKRLGLPHSLYTILQFLSVSLFEKTPILRAFSNIADQSEIDHNSNQLLLFEL